MLSNHGQYRFYTRVEQPWSSIKQTLVSRRFFLLRSQIRDLVSGAGLAQRSALEAARGLGTSPWRLGCSPESNLSSPRASAGASKRTPPSRGEAPRPFTRESNSAKRPEFGFAPFFEASSERR